MRILLLVNRVSEVSPTMTTGYLMRLLEARGHEVLVTGVAQLSFGPSTGEVLARARRVQPGGRLPGGRGSIVALSDCDLLIIRTNPARDPERAQLHHVAMSLIRIARDRGLLVVNDPDGLQRASSKVYLMAVPERFRPVTLISHDREALLDFVKSRDGRSVLKPLQGTHGRDVFVVSPDAQNLNQIVDVLLREGYAMAQEFVPEARDGDTRVLLLDGVPLRVDGKIAAVRRVPGGGDFRSNVHAGGHAAAVESLDPLVLEAAESIGPELARDGIVLAGLDVIGHKIVEINVFSTGGLPDAEQFAGVSFGEAIVTALEDRHRRHVAQSHGGTARDGA